MENLSHYPKATPQHRLAGIALDIVLLISTCYIGWIIWSLVIWNQGLTPAKQILKMRVVSSVTGQAATWGHMAIRQLLIPVALTIPFTILRIIADPWVFNINYWGDPYFYQNYFNSISAILIGLLSFGVSLFDAFWIFKGGQNRRFTDVWAKTDVINTAKTF